eukprot:9005540-Pyramimonas_sp.AAC.1
MRCEVVHAPDNVLTTGQKIEAVAFARWDRRLRQACSTLSGRASRPMRPSRSEVSKSIMMSLVAW